MILQIKEILLTKMDLNYNGKNKSRLYEAIDTLISTVKSSSTLDKIVEAKHTIVDYILNNKKEAKVWSFIYYVICEFVIKRIQK